MISMEIQEDPVLGMSITETQVTMTVEGYQEVGTDDYEKLINLPTLNGVPFIGNMMESDPQVPSWAKEETKPSYSSTEIGAVPEDAAIPLEELSLLFS